MCIIKPSKTQDTINQPIKSKLDQNKTKTKEKINLTEENKMKKTTKVIALICALALMTTLFAGCGEDKKEEGKTPHYIAATEPTFAPFDTVDEDGNIIGFDMDLMNAIAEDQGFTVEYKAFEFDALIPAVNAGNADMITAGMNAEDPERAKKVDFSDTYYDSGLVVLVKEDNNTIKGIDTLTSDMKIASQTGTTGADKANELKDEGKVGDVIINNGFDTCILQLSNGDVDAVIIDKPVAENAVGKTEGLKIVGEPLNAESYGFAVAKGNTELLEKINAGLKNVIENGTYDKLYDKWFGGNN